MRFRYIDEKGREVDLQTVEALAARIHLGAVHEDSPLYDAVADKWAPAGEHELFKQLKSEAEAKKAGGGKPSPLLGAVSHGPAELGKTLPELPAGATSEPAATPEASGAAKPDSTADPTDGDSTDSAASERVDSGPTGEDAAASHLSDAWEPLEDEPEPAVEDGGEAPPFADVSGFQDADSLGGEAVDGDAGLQLDGLVLADDFANHGPGKEGESGGTEVDGEDEGLVEGLESGRSEGDTRSASGAAAMPGWAAAPPPRTDIGETASEPGTGEAQPTDAEVAAEEEYLVRSASEARKSVARARAEERGGGPGGRGRRRRLVPQIPLRPLLITVVVVVAVAGVTVAILRNPDALPTFRNGPRTASQAASAEPTRPRPRAASLTAAEAGALAVGIETGVREALALLDSLEVQAGVAGGPPAAWLEGIYLANASDYPSVPRHWDGYRNFAAAANEVMLPRFREAALQAIGRQGFSGDDAEDLYDDGDHWIAPVEWEISELLEGLTDLAFTALELHEYLVTVEDRIRYDPFEDSSVPVDPVVEAIPLDEEVEEEMWGRIRRVADEVRETQESRDGLPQLGRQMADEARGSVD